MRDLAADADTLRRLHHEARPLVFVNVWDAASARTVVATGAPAVATSSGAVAASLGFEDGQGMPADVAFAAVQRIAEAVDVPVTADIEGGYGLDPEELVERLLAAGAVGCNFEDTDHSGSSPGPLVDAEVQAARVQAMVEAGRGRGVELVVNARIDVQLLQVGEPKTRVPEMLRRGRLYLEAGAACAFPIFVTDEGDIRELVDGLPGPVNVYLRPGVPPLETLRELGVARVSVGSAAFGAAMAATRAFADDLR
jgi:2-methylisocitrate lyase-like PEP mutase family enzyme